MSDWISRHISFESWCHCFNTMVRSIFHDCFVLYYFISSRNCGVLNIISGLHFSPFMYPIILEIAYVEGLASLFIHSSTCSLCGLPSFKKPRRTTQNLRLSAEELGHEYLTKIAFIIENSGTLSKNFSHVIYLKTVYYFKIKQLKKYYLASFQPELLEKNVQNIFHLKL